MPTARWRQTIRRRRSAGTRDDRVLRVTRWVAWFIVPWLVAAFLVLYGLPDRTTQLFAWTIRPAMTPVVMGAGYGAGVYFFYRVATADEWHTVAHVFLGITVFTWAMAIATLIHWGNFNHGHYTFPLWVFLYAITPLVVPAVWTVNRRTDPRDPPADASRIPRAIRLLGGGLGLVVTVSAVALFAVPDPMIDAWPWAVSPLTARILAGWFALFGVVNAAVALDPRWSAARIPLQSQILGFGLVLVGALRARADFDPANVLTWIVLGGMALYLAGVLALFVWMERR